MSLYRKTIEQITNDLGLDVEPRHVEAFMRLQYSTLDHLSREDFRQEIILTHEYVKVDGIRNADNLAKSFGL